MPTEFTRSADKAVEESTFIINCAFTDEDDNAVAPDTLTWTLTDEDGNVINSRDAVAVSSPTSSEDIVLSGADLDLDSGYSEQKRILLIEATYTSALGSGLPLKDKCIFYVTDIAHI